MAEDELGVTDTKEVIDFLAAYVEELKVAKSDDGKIDAREALAALTETSGKAIAAIMGSWNMSKELSNLDSAEKDELLARSMALVVSLTELILGVELEGE